jgi:DNA polymerase-3 subunit chi
VTSVDFYFNADDRLRVACRLATKAHVQRKRLLVYAPHADRARSFDRLLWTSQAVGFVPHCYVDSPLAAETPVLIALDQVAPADCEVLLNLHDECPPHFERFSRLLEIVSSEPADRQAGRLRFRFYRDRGYPIGEHNLAGTTAEPAGDTRGE